MKNGDYILVKAPDDYPGKKYRGRYCFEHHLVYWEHTGELPGDGKVIHHINHDKHDNRFENLAVEDWKTHSVRHNRERGRKCGLFKCPVCGKEFTRELRKTSFVKNNSVDYCSRECSGKGANKGYSSIVLLKYAKRMQGAY